MSTSSGGMDVASLTTMVSVDFTKLELHTIIRCMKVVKSDLEERKILLEGKLGSHGNGHTQGAILALENELVIVKSGLSKLWVAYEGGQP